MQPENDMSTGTDPSTADLADTGSVAPGPEGEVAEGTPAPQEARAEGVAESGAGPAKGTAGTVSGTATTAAEEQRRPLLADEELDGFRGRWDAVQVGFVDEPRGSVQQADALVAELMQRLAQTFSDERTSLESQWEQGADVSTEDLRVAMQRYRSFFDRLLRA
jgi:hypothetical protein